jgi:hypothetical protein
VGDKTMYVVTNWLSVIIICFLCCHMWRETKLAAQFCDVQINLCWLWPLLMEVTGH